MGRDTDLAMRRYFECSLSYRVEDLVGTLRELQRLCIDNSAFLSPKEMDAVLGMLETARRALEDATPSPRG